MKPTEKTIKKLLTEKKLTVKNLARVKRELAAILGIKNVPKTSQLLEEYHKLVKNGKVKKSLILEEFLRTRKVRTLSGVAVVTVLTKPFRCPGKCLYCPTEKGMPKSYLKNEPAAARAFALKFNPFNQVFYRLRALQATSHPTDKIELIVLGGTWSSYPEKYKYWFIKECFRAANEYNKNSKLKTKSEKQQRKTQNLSELKKEQRKNERAKNRIVGLTLETRPDCVDAEEIKQMRELGCTRVELGVQSLDDKILKFNRRGHNVKKTVQATKLLKNAGFKINYHLMLNLPGSTPAKDLAQFKELFKNSDFQPDLLKIYPCSVLRTAPLFKLWQQKKYKPYSPTQLKGLLLKIKQIIPPYVRVQRIIRDIPGQSIVAGSEISNLRQLIHQEMTRRKMKCRCIRCREVKSASAKNIQLVRRQYKASDGQEIFLSFEDKNKETLFALSRLRLPDQKEQPLFPVLKNAALIRELHTYGTLVPIAKNQAPLATQHKGLGKKLMRAAEKIVGEETDYKKIAVISGVGVRDYYRHLGYRLKDGYLAKNIRE